MPASRNPSRNCPALSEVCAGCRQLGECGVEPPASATAKRPLFHYCCGTHHHLSSGFSERGRVYCPASWVASPLVACGGLKRERESYKLMTQLLLAVATVAELISLHLCLLLTLLCTCHRQQLKLTQISLSSLVQINSKSANTQILFAFLSDQGSNKAQPAIRLFCCSDKRFQF